MTKGAPTVATTASHPPTALGAVLRQAVGRAGLRLAAASAWLVVVHTETNYLGAAGWGLLVTATAIVTTVGTLQDVGLQTAVARQLVESPHRQAALAGQALVTRLLLALAAGGAAVGIAALGWRHDHRVVTLVAVLVPLMVADAVQSTATSVFQATHHLALAGVYELLSCTLTLGAVLAAAHAHWGLVGLAACTAAGAGAGALVAILFARRLVAFTPSFDWHGAVRLLAGAAPLGATLVVGAVYSQIDIVIVSLLRDSRVVGIYGLAALGAQLASALPSFVLAATLPRMVGADDRATARWAGQLAGTAVTMVLPLLLLGALMAKPLVVLVAGPAYAGAAAPLAVLLAGTAVTMPTGILATVLIARHHERRLATIGLAVLAVNVAVNLVLVPTLGADGAAVAVVASELVALILTARCRPVHHLWRSIDLRQGVAAVPGRWTLGAPLLPLVAWALLVPSGVASGAPLGQLLEVAGAVAVCTAALAGAAQRRASRRSGHRSTPVPAPGTPS